MCGNSFAQMLEVEIIQIDAEDSSTTSDINIDDIMKARNFNLFREAKIKKKTIFHKNINLESKRTIRDGRNTKSLTSSSGRVRTYSSLFEGMKISASSNEPEDEDGFRSIDIDVTISKIINAEEITSESNSRNENTQYTKKLVRDGVSGMIKLRHTNDLKYLFQLELNEELADRSTTTSVIHKYYIYVKYNQ